MATAPTYYSKTSIHQMRLQSHTQHIYIYIYIYIWHRRTNPMLPLGSPNQIGMALTKHSPFGQADEYEFEGTAVLLDQSDAGLTGRVSGYRSASF